MSERALELLALPEDTPAFILDIGCGSGLSGECLTENGLCWIGVDISKSMLGELYFLCRNNDYVILNYAPFLAIAKEREVEGDVMNVDMGDGLPFRPGSFDGAISISALQWLCNADKAHHRPAKRLSKFFSTLYACLVRKIMRSFNNST